MDPGTIAMISQGAQGLASGIGALAGTGARRREERQARREYEQAMNAYKNFEFKNPYANLQNTAEDLTVNQQQAQFLAQQQQQGLANTMGAMQGAAGGSGIAALAQAMSNQQAQNLQQASASIGQQESSNQALAAQQAARNQMAEAQGAGQMQQMEFSRDSTILGMSQQRLAAARAARQQATQQLVGGLGQLGAAGAIGGVMLSENNGG
jgi:hypothetical protein